MSKETQAGIGCILFIVIIPLAVFVNGLLIAYGWGELILPIFPDLPTLSIWQAIGISSFVGLFTSGLETRKNDNGGIKSALITIVGVWLLEAFMIWAISGTY